MSFILLHSSLSSTKIHQTLSRWRIIGPSCMCIASARHEQPKQDKVVSKRSSWHRRSNLWHWILDQTNITNSSDLPDQIYEGILAGARHGKTKRNTGIMLCAASRLYRKKKTTENAGKRSMSKTQHRLENFNKKNLQLVSSSLSHHLTRKHKQTKSKRALHKDTALCILCTKKHQRKHKNKYNFYNQTQGGCTHLPTFWTWEKIMTRYKLLQIHSQSKLLDRSPCFSIVHIASVSKLHRRTCR